MPRHVDHDRRRAAITRAAQDLLVEGGVGAVNFRAIAERLGGSTTIVTHYYDTHQELLDDVILGSVDGWQDELSALEKSASTADERLKILLLWLLPTTRAGIRIERARINLLSSQIMGNVHRRAFTAFDETVRRMLRDHVCELVEPERIDSIVELLRVTINGIVLSVVERPSQWPKVRQLNALQSVIDAVDLGEGAGGVRLTD